MARLLEALEMLAGRLRRCREQSLNRALIEP
jgi:hypothetical protein